MYYFPHKTNTCTLFNIDIQLTDHMGIYNEQECFDKFYIVKMQQVSAGLIN